MARRVGDRIFGVETEFGCLVEDPSLRPEDAVELIKNYVFDELRLGAIDLHSRDEVFEPAGSGGFLRNGARFYIDAVGSHLEYATAECIDLKDLVANDRAGQRLIIRAIKELGLQDEVSVYNNSIDHFGGHTFGCHENYLVRMSEDFFSDQVNQLIPFLVTRQIYAGVGRVGGHVLYEGGSPDLQTVHGNPIDYIWVSNIYQVAADDSVAYQLSQRADHIIRTVASRVRFNRAIINPKWEHYYSHDGMHRLHILFGESNQSDYAYMLKIGTTSLVLRLLEDGLIPQDWELAEPLVDLRVVSRDEDYKWPVVLIGGEEIGAVALQLRYLELAEQYRDDSEQTNWILDEWATVLDALNRDPLTLGDRLDWVAKKKVVEMYRESEGLDWSDDALYSIDLEYHNIDPEKSLFHALLESGEMSRKIGELEIIDAGTRPPQNTRAMGRAAIVEHVLEQKSFLPYLFDWSGVALGRSKYLEMPDPFLTYEREAETFTNS